MCHNDARPTGKRTSSWDFRFPSSSRRRPPTRPSRPGSRCARPAGRTTCGSRASCASGTSTRSARRRTARTSASAGRTRTATFMILGDVCTRNCGYCAVAHGRPVWEDREEPERVGRAVGELGLEHVVDHLGQPRRPRRRRRRALRGRPSRAIRRARPGLPRRGADPGLPGQRRRARDRASRPAPTS